ncbi:MAG TPA: hypothetical protein VND87_09805 [Stellaceae bacterium]|nr:hypothetical protein [Stellaceae bacterium]
MAEKLSPDEFARRLAEAGLDPRHDPARFEELREGTKFLARLKASVRKPRAGQPGARDRAAEPAHIFIHPKG